MVDLGSYNICIGDLWDSNKAIDIEKWSIYRGGQLERFYCILQIISIYYSCLILVFAMLYLCLLLSFLFVLCVAYVRFVLVHSLIKGGRSQSGTIGIPHAIAPCSILE